MKNFILLSIIITFSSCSSKPFSEITKSTEGIIINGTYVNDYLTIDIPTGWSEMPSSESSNFLVIGKDHNDPKPSIILVALNKKEIKEVYGFQSAEEYMMDLTEYFESKPEYQLINGLDSIKIDNKATFLSNFKLTKDSIQLSQSYSATDLEDIYFGIVATNGNKESQVEIEKIINSIKFK